MAKPKQSFVCNSCGCVYPKWTGKCDDCGEWNTITEDVSATTQFSKLAPASNSKTGAKKQVIELFSFDNNTSDNQRLDTQISELNRVFGGGIVEASATLIGGEPGVGKSTILLQLAANISQDNKVIYITGEESVSQVSLRAKRLNLASSKVQIASATNVAEIISLCRSERPNLVIIDSIQTMFLPQVESAPGTVSQVRVCAHELINIAKTQGFSLILVGHVTKEGQIAGPRVLEHMVDTVLYFEGERGVDYRIIRAVKNRFGAANEIGVFEMAEGGLREVTNPSELFISGGGHNISGSTIFSGIEGSRPLLCEIQALVSPSYMPTPRRAVVGWDANRLAMLTAVLQTRASLKLYDKEIYLNVVGGIKLSEPAADLAVAASIISALNNRAIGGATIIFGEVGLSGEVRAVSKTAERIREAEKLGFKNAIIPHGSTKVSTKLNITQVRTISDLLLLLN